MVGITTRRGITCSFAPVFNPLTSSPIMKSDDNVALDQSENINIMHFDGNDTLDLSDSDHFENPNIIQLGNVFNDTPDFPNSSLYSNDEHSSD